MTATGVTLAAPTVAATAARALPRPACPGAEGRALALVRAAAGSPRCGPDNGDLLRARPRPLPGRVRHRALRGRGLDEVPLLVRPLVSAFSGSGRVGTAALRCSSVTARTAGYGAREGLARRDARPPRRSRRAAPPRDRERRRLPHPADAASRAGYLPAQRVARADRLAPRSGSARPARASTRSSSACTSSTTRSAGVDGYYGYDDVDAVYAFQKLHGLPRTGSVDARFWRRLQTATVPRRATAATTSRSTRRGRCSSSSARPGGARRRGLDRRDRQHAARPLARLQQGAGLQREGDVLLVLLHRRLRDPRLPERPAVPGEPRVRPDADVGRASPLLAWSSYGTDVYIYW